MHYIDSTVISLFGIIILFAGMYKRGKTESSYLVADRKTGLFALTATLVMTEFNTATLLAFSSLGYIAGFWGLILPIVFLIGLLFYAISVAKKWKSFDGLSVAGFFSQRYGKDLGRFVSLTILVGTACFSAAYIKSLVIIFQPLFPGFSNWTISAIFIGIMFLLTVRGGLISVIYTDVVSFIVTAIFIPVMTFFVWKGSDVSLPSVSEAISQGMGRVPFWYVASLIVLTMFTYILAPGTGQKIFSAKSQKIAYLSMIFSCVLVFILYEFAVLSAAFLHNSGVFLADSEFVLPHILDKILPKGLKGLGYGVFFAASATTIIGAWSAMNSMIVGDFFRSKSDSNKSLYRVIFITLSVAMGSYFLSNLFIDRVLDKIILINIPIAALCFSLLAGFYWKKASKGGAYCSITVGLICGLGSYLYFGEQGGYTWYWSMMGIPLIFLSGVIGSYLFPAKNLESSLVVE